MHIGERGTQRHEYFHKVECLCLTNMMMWNMMITTIIMMGWIIGDKNDGHPACYWSAYKTVTKDNCAERKGVLLNLTENDNCIDDGLDNLGVEISFVMVVTSGSIYSMDVYTYARVWRYVLSWW